MQKYILDCTVQNAYVLLMARSKEFDRDQVLERAMRLFWAQGYAATTTEDLVGAMGISRQSLYDTFGDKQALYLEALQLYHHDKAQPHESMTRGKTAFDSIRLSLLRPVERPTAQRAIGCMGINATVSFCGADATVMRLAGGTAERAEREFIDMVEVGIERGEFDIELDASAAGRFLYVTLQGLTVRAQAGASPKALRSAVDFALRSLT
jgi:AcrR family transcriptional regulator